MKPKRGFGTNLTTGQDWDRFPKARKKPRALSRRGEIRTEPCRRGSAGGEPPDSLSAYSSSSQQGNLGCTLCASRALAQSKHTRNVLHRDGRENFPIQGARKPSKLLCFGSAPHNHIDAAAQSIKVQIVGHSPLPLMGEVDSAVLVSNLPPLFLRRNPVSLGVEVSRSPVCHLPQTERGC